MAVANMSDRRSAQSVDPGWAYVHPLRTAFRASPQEKVGVWRKRGGGGVGKKGACGGLGGGVGRREKWAAPWRRGPDRIIIVSSASLVWPWTAPADLTACWSKAFSCWSRPGPHS